MASREQRRSLNEMVLEAVRYQRWCGGHENPALGEAITEVDRRLLPWTERQVAEQFDDSPPDAESLVSDAGVQAILQFHTFDGTTGGQFYRWMKAIVAQAIVRARRVREAARHGGLRRIVSLERSDQAAKLANQLVSPGMSAEEAASIHENSLRLHGAIRSLGFVEKRVVRLWLKDRSLREIAATFGHATSWAQGIWDSAAQNLVASLARGRRKTRRRAAVAS